MPSEVILKNWIRSTATLALTLCLFQGQAASADINGGAEMLNEVPLWPVPSAMTLEEYTDANRRLGVGLALMAVPIPGALHFYADEGKEGWMHVGAAVLGVASIVAGAAIVDDKDSWKSSNFEILDIVGQNGKTRRYEKVPVEEEAGATNYELRKLDRKTSGDGGAVLIVAGAGLVIGQFLHGWIDGIRTIERKRDAVRFKYGKSSGFSLSLVPEADLHKGKYGAALALRF
jgi:hypothetical protein